MAEQALSVNQSTPTACPRAVPVVTMQIITRHPLKLWFNQIAFEMQSEQEQRKAENAKCKSLLLENENKSGGTNELFY